MSSKLCTCTESCGCGEDVLSSKQACESIRPECDSSECAESFDGKCIQYTGDTIVNLNITKGMSFNDIIQKMVLLITNPGCNYPNSVGQSAIGFYSKKITQTTASFVWTAPIGFLNPSYQIQYRIPSNLNWTALPAVTALTDTIGGLLPNTKYHVKLITTLNSISCSSVILEITTKP